MVSQAAFVKTVHRVFDINLHKAKMAMVQINIEYPDKLAKFARREYGIIIDKIKKNFAAGANVVLTNFKGIDDLTWLSLSNVEPGGGSPL